MSTQFLISAAEAAFIAGLSDRQMNRVIDENLMPAVLFEHLGSSRKFTRLCAAFAKFYFDCENWLVAGARRKVLEELTDRVVQLRCSNELLSLVMIPDKFSWKVIHYAVEVDVAPYVAEVSARANDVSQADALVMTSADVMGGVAVFAGTRVPIDIVLGSAAAGVDAQRLKAAYPFLTDAHFQAARVYENVHPRRGRPRRLAEINPPETRRVSKVVRRAVR